MNRKLSREEAVSMLNNWNVGSTRISGSIQAGSILVSFKGYISEVSERIFKIIQAPGLGDDSKAFGMISIGLNTAREYESTVKETDDRLSTVTALQIHFLGFITCAIFEYDWHLASPYRM